VQSEEDRKEKRRGGGGVRGWWRWRWSEVIVRIT